MEVSLQTVLIVIGVPNGKTGFMLTLKKLYWLCCPQAKEHIVFCSPCLSTLLDALSSHSQLVNKLQTGFQSLENKLSKKIGSQITV